MRKTSRVCTSEALFQEYSSTTQKHLLWKNRLFASILCPYFHIDSMRLLLCTPRRYYCSYIMIMSPVIGTHLENRKWLGEQETETFVVPNLDHKKVVIFSYRVDYLSIKHFTELFSTWHLNSPQCRFEHQVNKDLNCYTKLPRIHNRVLEIHQWMSRCRGQTKTQRLRSDIVGARRIKTCKLHHMWQRIRKVTWGKGTLPRSVAVSKPFGS